MHKTHSCLIGPGFGFPAWTPDYFVLFVLACLGVWRGFGEKRDTNTTDWQLLPSATNLTMRLLRAERSEKLLSAEKEGDTSWVLLKDFLGPIGTLFIW